MAKYSDGVTEAMAGDIVKCVFDGLDGISIGAVCCVSECCGQNVKLTSTWGLLYGSCYFDFIRRNGQSAPSPEPEQPKVNNEQSPPLVVWPEAENQPSFNLLCVVVWFVWANVPQRPCVRHADCKFAYFDSPTVLLNGNNCEPVRRLKMTVSPEFVVI